MDSSFRERYGPWALVTGASSGIGREIAVQAAERGVNVLLAGRDAARLQEAAARIRAQGREAEVLVADLGCDFGIQALLDRTAAFEIGLLVPAAGFGAGGEFMALARDEALDMVRLNCESVMRLLLHLTPGMARRGRGGVLLVAGILAFHGVPYAALYAATKAFVQSLGEGLATELAGYGVEVLISSPGPTDTGFAARARMRLPITMRPEDVARASLHALGRSRVVLPGAMTKLLHNATFGLPRAAKVRVIGRIM